jgi:hypothetical protein
MDSMHTHSDADADANADVSKTARPRVFKRNVTAGGQRITVFCCRCIGHCRGGVPPWSCGWDGRGHRFDGASWTTRHRQSTADWVWAFVNRGGAGACRGCRCIVVKYASASAMHMRMSFLYASASAMHMRMSFLHLVVVLVLGTIPCRPKPPPSLFVWFGCAQRKGHSL